MVPLSPKEDCLYRKPCKGAYLAFMGHLNSIGYLCIRYLIYDICIRLKTTLG